MSGWQFISIVLSIGAAALGLWVMRPVKGDESNPATLFEHLKAKPYSIEHRIVKDNLQALTGELKLLGKIARTLTVGYTVLAVAWVSMVAIAGLSELKII